MKTQISKEIFNELYTQIIEKCKSFEGFRELGKGEALYGFGRFVRDTDSMNIKNIMLQNDKVKACIDDYGKKLNGKYLYDRRREWQNPQEELITLTSFYRDVFLSFLDHESFDGFLQYLQDAKLIEPDVVELQNNLNSPDQAINSKNATHYKGYYYDFRSRSIKDFHLKIDASSNSAQLVGLHASLSVGKTKTKYHCKIEYPERHLRFELQSEFDRNDKISLILYRGTRTLEEQKYLRGIYLIVSTFEFPVTGEVILTKLQKHEGQWQIPLTTEMLIKQYLNLERKSFYTPKECILNDKHLKPKNKSLEILKPLIGYYKAWSFSYFTRDSETEHLIRVYQSKFSINEDYSSELVSAYSHEEKSASVALECWLWVTDEVRGARKVSVTAFDRDSFIIKSHAMIEIPDHEAIHSLKPKTKEEEEEAKYIKGVYCSFGNQNRDFLASALIFERIGKQGQTKQEVKDEYEAFKPESFTKDQILKVPSNKAGYEALIKHYEATTIQAEPK